MADHVSVDYGLGKIFHNSGRNPHLDRNRSCAGSLTSQSLSFSQSGEDSMDPSVRVQKGWVLLCYFTYLNYNWNCLSLMGIPTQIIQ
jgi:hypothetical protein